MEAALNNLVKEYVKRELKYNPPPEKESDASESQPARGNRSKRSKKQSHHAAPTYSSDQEYIDALQTSLEQKGVLREMQTFLRQKLVLILQEKWPDLSVSRSSQMIQPAVIKLMQDFLCCRKLLYTFSVMSSELGVTYSSKVKFGKLPCLDAERLLEEFDIRINSKLSQRILKMYADKEYTSLLECLIQALSWFCDEVPPPLFSNSPKDGPLFNGINRDRKASRGTGTKTRYEYERSDAADMNPQAAKTNEGDNLDVSMDERLIALQMQLEESKERELQREIQRFKETELVKIREELQAEMRLQLMAKETQLLQDYNTKLDNMKEEFEREKMAWFATKEQELLLCKKCSKGNLQTDLANSNTNEGSPNDLIRFVSKQNIATMTVSDDMNEDAESVLSRRLAERIPSKETRLRESICRLQEQNKRLAEERDFYASRSREELGSGAPQRQASTVDSDSIAFLKYNLERQSEEITELKRRIYLDNNLESAPEARAIAMPGNSDAVRKDTCDDADLVDFLAQSRQRCSQIKQDSEMIANKVVELRYKRSRPSTPVFTIPKQSTILKPSFIDSSNSYSMMSTHMLSQLNNPSPPILPNIQPSMILKRPLLEWKQQQVESSSAIPSNCPSLNQLDLPGTTSISMPILHTVLDKKNELLEMQSFFDNKISADLHALNQLRQEHLSHLQKSQEIGLQSTIDQAQNETVHVHSPLIPSVSTKANTIKPSVISEVIPKLTESKSRSRNEIKKSPVQSPVSAVGSSSQENSPLLIVHAGSSSNKPSPNTRQHVKNGALSFEKIASEDEISQRSSAKELSSRSSKSSFKIASKDDKLIIGKVDSSEQKKMKQTESSVSPKKDAATSDPKVLAETHDKYALRKVVGEYDAENKSMSLSGPSQGGDSEAAADDDGDSEFWKL